ncbi:hypothetical protein EDB85DRAFT_2143453 [Lactarius pseudohatsudake]|nr:hypothetical protein EDB85DRAFT_2143453 [Lactarius pseudohatsudake]
MQSEIVTHPHNSLVDIRPLSAGSIPLFYATTLSLFSATEPSPLAAQPKYQLYMPPSVVRQTWLSVESEAAGGSWSRWLRRTLVTGPTRRLTWRDAGLGNAQRTPAKPSNAHHSIPIAKLSRPDPILFYAETPLFNGELHDNAHRIASTRLRGTSLFLIVPLSKHDVYPRHNQHHPTTATTGRS